MKKLITVVLVFMVFVFSGCVVAHRTYIRNLTEHVLEITFVFDQTAAPFLPDSLYVPSSATSHLISSKTCEYMKDSIVAKKSNTKRMKLVLLSGQMIMLDKNLSKKTQYHDPVMIIVDDPGFNKVQEVVYSSPTQNQKLFQIKGSVNKLYWFDYY